MRGLSRVLCAVVGLCVFAACDRNEGEQSEEAPSAAAAPTATNSLRANVLARFGGVLVPAQRFFVELFPRANGEVEAKVYDAEGNEVSGEAGATLTVKVQGADQQRHDVPMRWDAERGRFHGSAGAGVQVAPGPVEVSVESEGETSSGRAETVPVAPEPQGGGTIVLAGDLSTEVRAQSDGKVEAVVLDAQGQPLNAEAGVEVTVEVKGAGDDLHPVRLQWDGEAGYFVGRVGADVQIQPGPFQVIVERNGQSHRGRLELAAVTPQPSVDGRVVVAGDHSVEIAPAGDGKLEAVIVDARGQRVTGQAGVTLTVNVQVGGSLSPVVLAWDAEREKWAGEIDVEGDVELATAPVEVVLVANGHRRRGRWGRGLALGHAHAAAGGRADVAAPGVDVRANAPGANVRVDVPGAANIRGPAGGVDLRGAGGVRVRGAGAAAGVKAGGGAVRVQGPAANARVGAAVQAGGQARVQAAAAQQQAAEARREAEAARRRAQEAARAGGGASVMGGVSVMAGGGLSIGN